MEQGWEEFFHNVLGLLDFASVISSRNEIELCVSRLEDIIIVLNQVLPQVNVRNFIIALLGNLNELYNQLNISLGNYNDGNSNTRPSCVASILNVRNFERSQGAGRPKFHIPCELLIELRETGHSWSAISKMFLVSKWTILRRVREYNLENYSRFSDITDNDLDSLILCFYQRHGYFIGFSLVYGYLKAKDLHIQHRRIKESIRRIDPEGARLRCALVVSRRSYNVRAPNSLWHIDGHHSLVTWKFVIHGSIDGFSRLITFLRCSTNNYSETVYKILKNPLTSMELHRG